MGNFRALAARAGTPVEEVAGLDGLRKLMGGSGVVLVAATDGNHGRAVARMAALLGLQAHILVPRDMAVARLDALRAEGAQVTVVDGTYDEAVTRSAALADDQHVVVSDTSWDGYVNVPGWAIDGYATIVAETLLVLAESGIAPDAGGGEIGVGAFAASIVRGFVPLGARVVGVEPTKAACLLESVRAGRRATQRCPGFDHGGPERRNTVDDRVAGREGPASTRSSLYRTTMPKRLCARWPTPASSPASPVRRPGRTARIRPAAGPASR